MSLFVIADLHLSLNGEKPMDVFRGWHNYVERLEDNWRRVVQEGDTVVIAGDISWAMKLEDAVQERRYSLRGTTTTGGPPAARLTSSWRSTAFLT